MRNNNLKRFALFVMLALAAFAQSVPVVEVHIAPGVWSVLNAEDLGNTWYSGDKVKLDAKLQDVIAWMVENGAPGKTAFHTAFTTDPNRPAPTSLVFEGEAGKGDGRHVLLFAIDAVWTVRSPGVALADVRTAFGRPLDHPVTYPGFAPRHDADPVGQQIAYRLYDVSENFSAEKWPVGSIYKRIVKRDGIDDQEHYERTSRVVTPGTFFQPGKSTPAWLRMR